MVATSDQVCHVHRHLVDLCVVEDLNVLQHAVILPCDEVNGYTFSTKPSSTTNPGRRGRGGEVEEEEEEVR